MYMLLRKAKRDESTLLGKSGGVETFPQDVPPFLVGQQKHSTVARDRQLMEVAGLMKCFDVLAVIAHDKYRKLTDWSDQAPTTT